LRVLPRLLICGSGSDQGQDQRGERDEHEGVHQGFVGDSSEVNTAVRIQGTGRGSPRHPPPGSTAMLVPKATKSAGADGVTPNSSRGRRHPRSAQAVAGRGRHLPEAALPRARSTPGHRRVVARRRPTRQPTPRGTGRPGLHDQSSLTEGNGSDFSKGG
jgi:hypothetical protein